MTGSTAFLKKQGVDYKVFLVCLNQIDVGTGLLRKSKLIGISMFPSAVGALHVQVIAASYYLVILRMQEDISMQLRYDVYDDLYSEANFFLPNKQVWSF